MYEFIEKAFLGERRIGDNMAGSGKRWVFCLLAVLLASGCAEDQVNSDIETKETTQKSDASRSGAYYAASEEDSHLGYSESNKQQHSDAYAGPGGAGASYSYSDHQKAYENSQHHASQYQQVNQPRQYVPPLYGQGPVLNAQNVGGYNYQQSNKEMLKQQYYNHNHQANHNYAGYVVDNIITRPIPYNEYYWLHRQPGYENSISCQREGELHSYWTPTSECMICTCVREWAYLEPACVSCGLCSNSPLPLPIPVVTSANILPIYIEPTTEIIPQPIPEIAQCSPMPSGIPFQNPLHPCQICVCYESLNVFGVPDVKIECEENPQCVLPPEPIPYIPDKPLPLPQCEKFPNNVVFPHPIEACKICKCTVEITPYGPQDQIICFPDSDCISPIPIIIPEPVTVYPIPPEPIIIPVPEPIWPPVTPRPGPGPLPGPSPHESCRPYLPNQPFQHPWDECQVCVCVEGYTVGQITIEVNCYTKRSCCAADLPLEPTIGPLPYIPTHSSFSLKFVYPSDECKISTCELQATPVYPYHVPGYVPGGLQPGYNNLISPRPGYGNVPGYGPIYPNYGQNPYLPVTYGQGTYGPGVNYGQTAHGQSTAFDESEHYDKSLSYDQKAYAQSANGQGVLYAPGTYGGVNYGQSAYGQSTAFDESEHYDKSLNYDQKAYAQSANGQRVLYGPGTYGGVNYGQSAYGQNTAFDESEHYDKSLSYDQKAYAQSANGQGVLYAPGTYGGVNYGQSAYGQSTAFDESEHYDKSLSYDQKAYAQSANGQGVLYAPGTYGGVNYGQSAYGQSTAFDESEHYDKSLSYDQKAYAQSANGQGVLYAPGTYGGVNYGQSAYGQSNAFDESEHYDKSLSYDQKAYAQSANGQGGLYAPGTYGGVNYGQSAYGQSTAFDEREHYDKNLNYAQNAYGQGQGVNYGVYGQIPVKTQVLGVGVGPVKLSVKARTKSGDPENNEDSDERK